MLFKSSDKLKEYAQLVGTVELASIKATLNFVEDQHIQSVLGKELYITLQEAYTDAATDDVIEPPELKELLEQCRKVIGPMFCYYYAPKADVLVSDSGVQRVETSSNKTAYQYQNTNYLQANLAEAEACTELLIEFLEDNKDSYPQWSDSDAFKKYRSLFIKSGKEFDQLFTSHTPYRNYYAIRAKMVDVEEINIRDLLGDTLYNDLKEKDADDYDFSIKELMLFLRIKKAIAYFTVAFSLPMLNVRIDGNGLSVISLRSMNSNDKDNTRMGADDNARTELIRSCIASGEVWITNTINFLKSNKTDFATWKGFDVPVIVETSSVNDDLTGAFGLL